MAKTNPSRRIPAGTPARKSVKASILVDVELHARWSAAASLRGMDRSAFAVEALRTAVKGIHIIDRSRSGKDEVASSDEEDRQVA